MKRYVRYFVLALVMGLVFSAAYVRLPYYAEGPGPASEVGPLIQISGRPTYPSAGKLIMTTVSVQPLTPLLAFFAWLDPHRSVLPKDQVYPPNVPADVEQQRGLSDMDQSKIDAAYVVLSKLEHYPKQHGTGALIETTYQGCPADGHLHAGDIIQSIDHHPIATKDDASKLMAAAKVGDPLDFQVRAAGETHDINVAKGTCPGTDKALFGVSLVDVFPFSLNIASGNVVGPSAGLMFALGLYDALTPGDLTRSRTIAGTGTIGLDGKVGPIGGITDKVVAAERVGASVFLVPKDNMAELQGVDTGDMKLISVATFQEAVDALSAPA